MTDELKGFDAEKVEPVGFDPLPVGTYSAIIQSAEKKATKAGDGHYANLKIHIVDGPHKGRVLFDILNIWNKKEMTKRIAAGQLSSICRAIGKLRPDSLSDLCNCPLSVTVGQREYNGQTQNSVKSYKPLQTEAAAPASEPANEGKPW